MPCGDNRGQVQRLPVISRWANGVHRMHPGVVPGRRQRHQRLALGFRAFTITGRGVTGTVAATAAGRALA
jgi:hypothetical protein